MNVSYKWLQQYVSLPWPAAELAERLTMAGMEVEDTYSLDPGLAGVVVGKIVAVNSHPNADELYVCTVNVGEEELTIVAGADNVRSGLKVPVALIGAELPGGMVIAETDLRGVVSSGMMCSEKELQLGDDHSGIMELAEDAPIGRSLSAVLELDDSILDVSIYANRPDCMSMLGMAREVAALHASTITYPAINVTENAGSIDEKLTLRVEDPDLCPRYMARVITDVKIGPSPLWIQVRLRAAGMRPINNVVDITNFVMLETGQPLHAFDYDALSGRQIVVRRARPGEKLVTLDEQIRELDSDMLMICDAEKPVCIGGVMGGANSEVTATTSTLVLEAANFQPASIRRTSRRLGISSEAAARFEKGLSPYSTDIGLERAAMLLQQYAQGSLAHGVLDEYPSPAPRPRLKLRFKEIRRLLGMDVPSAAVEEIMRALEFRIESADEEGMMIEVPAFRTDVERECDLIEEVARHYGYDRIPVTLPASGAEPGGQSPRQRAVSKLRQLMAGLGLQEAINYSFIAKPSMQRLGYGEAEVFEGLTLKNPLSAEQSVMRPSLIPGLLDALGRNYSRQQQRVALFELGSVYLAADEEWERAPEEVLRLSGVLMGVRDEHHWSRKNQTFDFYDVKGLVEVVIDHFSVGPVHWKRANQPWLHPGRSVEVFRGGELIARLGQIHPRVADSFKVPLETLVFDINVGELLEHFGGEAKAAPLPKYPGIDRDLAVLLEQEIPVGEVARLMEQMGNGILKKVDLFDVYQGPQVPEGRKSAAFSLYFQADRNLKDAEVQTVVDEILLGLKEQFGAELR